MTTIAYRDGILVADSQGTNNGRAELGFQKIRVAPDDANWTVFGKPVAVYGAAGLSSAKEYVRRALVKGLDVECPISPKDLSFSALIITEDGESFIWSYSHTSRTNQFHHDIRCKTGPAAIGSGASYALAVMAIGADPYEAVKTAITFDIYSGGELSSFDLKKHLENRIKPDPKAVIEE